MFHVDLVHELPGMVFCQDEAVGAARWFPARLLELISSASHEQLHNVFGVQGDQGGGCSTAEELHPPAMEPLEVLHAGVWAAGGPGGHEATLLQELVELRSFLNLCAGWTITIRLGK